VTAVPFFVVDAFADEPFSGNPAAVALFAAEPAPETMAKIAAEANLSETAFVWPSGDGFGLRWFTPVVEVPLCGHATLAAAAVLLRERGESSPVRFATKSGVLECREEDGGISLDLPELPCEPWPVPEELAGSFGLREIPEGWIARAAENAVLRLPDGASLDAVAPDLGRLGAATFPGVSGVILTVRGDGKPYDFQSRYFSPWAGIPEDPVTGSAHCTLAPFWSPILGKDEFTARQASRRGGVLRLRRAGGRVRVAGNARTVVRGELEF
jgi:PhzF family phenazine biosynthesis protein